MHFEAATATTLWFEQWHTFSGLTYAASCAGLLTLCVVHKAIDAYRCRFYEQYVQTLQVMRFDETHIVEANNTQEEKKLLGCARYRHSQRLCTFVARL